MNSLKPIVSVRGYRDLLVWQRGVDLAVECHLLARRLPADERFELSRQLRRAATSVPANIAEGNGRFSIADYLRHLSIANGSLNETGTDLTIAERCGYLSSSDIANGMRLTVETAQLLVALAHSLRRSSRA